MKDRWYSFAPEMGLHPDQRQSILRLVSAIRERPGDRYELSAMAEAIAISRFHFLRVFTEATSVSPMRYLAACRIERAKRLLLETDKPISLIGIEVGYTSLGTFTRLFTEFVGTTPGGFRVLADRLSNMSTADVLEPYLASRQLQYPCSIEGSILGPSQFEGVIFVGLFPTPIPRGRPLSGTLLLHLGRFTLPPASIEPRSCILAAALPLSNEIRSYLLPDQEELLVASTMIGSGTANRDLTLRRVHELDLPVVVALPLLLKTSKSG